MSKYVIFGGTGSLGKKILDRLLPNNQLVVYSRDEAKHWTIKNDLQTKSYKSNFSSYIGDIRDYNRILEVLRLEKPETIIIASALKQVDTCENSPYESIQTNILGIQNIINAINSLNLDTLQNVLFVSTDKACAPTNVYGMCKSISERLIVNQSLTGLKHIKYLVTRYGNVLESRGSIIPLFKYQCENKKFITVTEKTMTRFIMTLDESVDLIIDTLKNGKSGETWIPILNSMRIQDLAEIFSEKYNKDIKYIGIRPGEKIHEDLISETESIRTHLSTNTKNNYIIDPIYKDLNEQYNKFIYSSSNSNSILSKSELYSKLVEYKVLNMNLNDFVGLKIEEIVDNQ